MRNCEQMTRLISESMERPLTKSERVEMAFHTMMCSGCKNFKKNTISLGKITKLHNSPLPSKTEQQKTDTDS